MQEEFHQSSKLDKSILRGLMTRKSGTSALLFGLQFALMWGAAAFVVLGVHRPWWQLLPALFIFGLITMSMFAITHEASHNTAFASRWLNEVVLWLACIPIYYTPTGFRQFHWAHHRHTNDPQQDPEISVGGKPAPAFTSSMFIYLGYITGLPILLAKIGFVLGAAAGGPKIVWQTLLSFVEERYRSRMSWEARFSLLFHTAWIVTGILWLPGLLMLLLGQLIGHAMLSVYLIAEHNGLPHEGDILDRTRTTYTTSGLRLLMWNMPYHAEHHAYPAVPWHALPRLNKAIKAELKRTSDGYTPLHAQVLQQLAKGQAFVDLAPPHHEEPLQ